MLSASPCFGGMKLTRLMAVCLIVASPVLAQTHHLTSSTATHPAIVELSRDSSFHQLFANEQARAFAVELGPHQSSLLDRHEHDYLIVALDNGDVEASGSGNQAFHLQMQGGEMQVMKGGWPHRISNLGSTSLHLLELEVSREIQPERALCGLSAQECTEGKFGNTDEGTYTQNTLFETPSVTLMRIELGPASSLPAHGHHGGQVVIALSDLALQNEILGEQATAIHESAGKAVWLPGNCVHQLRNESSQPARFLELEVR